MSAKAFGAKTDPKLAELQWNNMRAYFATAMAITDDGHGRRPKVLPHPEPAERRHADRQFLCPARRCGQMITPASRSGCAARRARRPRARPRRRLRKRSSSRPQPLPTVPEPRNSPGWMVSSVETWAMRSSNVVHRAGIAARPFLAVHAGDHGQVVGVGHLVGRDEPRPDARCRCRNPCPWPGPSWPCISAICASRALKSLKIV